MWIILGLSAIVTACLNLYCWSKGKEAKWFRFLSLSLTALTLCANYSHDAQWVISQDWSALEDVKRKYAGKTVLLVCHGGVCRMVKSYFEDLTNEEYGNYHAPNAQLVEYEL